MLCVGRTCVAVCDGTSHSMSRDVSDSVAALSTACPFCGVGPHVACMAAGQSLTSRVHPSRVDAHLRSVDADVVDVRVVSVKVPLRISEVVAQEPGGVARGLG